MKYFFLSSGWKIGRVWEFGGLWDQNSWRRSPVIDRLNLAIIERGEVLWLYGVEDAVIMLEVFPSNDEIADTVPTIGQVVIKRLISGEQALEILQSAETVIKQPLGS
ncbi:MAG: hypothetical protein N5P05_000913 [Chroococcopsis gigantea SAG 12.99]|nr:hypothetical protein [Chlorogloea purpurea SAG 13.99]MDV2999307.1 hypothetical protein [Chroococcopsis gigantea SAG 12.99]